jgi:hypothetical protein
MARRRKQRSVTFGTRTAAPAAPDTAQRRDITTRDVSLRAQTANDDARTVDAVLATERVVQVFDWMRERTIDEVLMMAGARMPAQMPLLETHSRYSLDSMHGVIRGMRIEDGAMVGTLHFEKEGGARTDRAWRMTRSGSITDISVGYRVTKYEEIPPGESRDIAGRTWTADKNRWLRIATEWDVVEGSLVPIGADRAAKVREDAQPGPTPQKENEMPQTPTEPTADGVRTAPAPAPATPPVDTDAIRAEGKRLERERMDAIRSLAQGVAGITPELLTRAEKEDWTVERAGKEFLTALRATEQAPVSTVRVTDAQQQGMRQAIVDGMVLRAGLPVTDPAAQRNAREFQHLTLHEMARASLQMAGRPVPIDGNALFRAVAEMDLQGRAGAGFSTFSLPTLLGDTFNRVLQAEYERTPGTLLQWARPVEVKDFREVSNVRFSVLKRFPKVGPGGMLEHTSAVETKEKYRVETHGVRMTVTRNQWIDDDLGALLRVPAELGEMAKTNIDDVGYDLLISASGVGPTLNEDGKALFATNHDDGANYITGNALSDASLALAKTRLMKMKHNGRSISPMPDILLVPPELVHTALKLVQSSELQITGSTDRTEGTANVHRGSLRVIVEPRLSAATNGTTAFYLIASRFETVVVPYLRGHQGPTLERNDPTDALGFGWWCYHDTGAGVVDYRGIDRTRGA